MNDWKLWIALLLLPLGLTGQENVWKVVVQNEANNQPIPRAEIYLAETGLWEKGDEEGVVRLTDLPAGKYNATVFAEGFATLPLDLTLQADNQSVTVQLKALNYRLSEVEISTAGNLNSYRFMRGVEGVGIYAAKKSEVINLDNLTANLATNNAREVYRGIAGLNIWENDGAGLQLAIGARGLDPNRTSNFNTRQNGFDISADALGYPESYYTPPTQALQRIEVVRGAASLQYGPQFGGLLNFKLKEGPEDKAFEFISENTVGSFGLFNSFNSIGGTKGKVNYYAFYQRKQGDGWRPNAEFEQNTAYVDLHYQFSERFRIGLEVTHMNYLAQQPGGLVDFEFDRDPRQSKRARNWFKVNWNLAALHIDYDLSNNTKLNFRNFLLDAQREALGELGPINRPDPLRERDLILGKYQNLGSEGRLIHTYSVGPHLANLLVGYRYYRGYTTNQQGDAPTGDAPDFRFLNPGDLEQSDYEFPSRNVSFFAENLFNLGQKWTITPGVRFEYIRTSSDGYYKQRVFSGGQVIFEQKLQDSRLNERQFLLLGLGVGYRVSDDIEAYANISQNYRAINFSDLAVVNPNLVIDSLLRDESGYNADIGLRGQAAKGLVRFDLSAFYLRYNDRIGLAEQVVSDPVVIERLVAYRTNIGDARIMGLEAYAETDIWKLLRDASSPLSIRPYLNISLLHGRYITGKPEFRGKNVELIPPVNIKAGASLSYRDFQANFLFTHVQEHYSDATNAVQVANATRGIIPSYQVMDLSLSYTYRRFRLQTGVNNLANAAYFTRRATGYPGPGIIPAEGRSFYVTFRVRL